MSLSLGNTSHGTILVQGLFSLSRLPVDTIRTTEIVKFGPLLHFRDAICDYGVYLGFGHMGHMDVSLGRGFSR